MEEEFKTDIKHYLPNNNVDFKNKFKISDDQKFSSLKIHKQSGFSPDSSQKRKTFNSPFRIKVNETSSKLPLINKKFNPTVHSRSLSPSKLKTTMIKSFLPSNLF